MPIFCRLPPVRQLSPRRRQAGSCAVGELGQRGQSIAAPLVEAIRRHLLAASKLRADNTPIPVLAPGNGKTKTARLWTFVRGDRPAGDTAPRQPHGLLTRDRKGICPQTQLTKFIGLLQKQMLTPTSMPPSTARSAKLAPVTSAIGS